MYQKVELIGFLGADPECRATADGKAVTNTRIATSESWKDKATGEKREATEWHRVVFYGKLGEIAGEYLKKGSLVRVEGRIRTRKWQDKEGQDRYSTDIDGTDMLMLPNGKSKGDAAEKPQRSKPEGVPASSSNRFNDSDDGPF